MNNGEAGSNVYNYRNYLVVFIIGAVIGAWGMYTWFVSDLRAQLAVWQERYHYTQEQLTEELNKPPQIKTETKTETQIAYVPKETVIYRDPVTGELAVKKEKTDFQMDTKPPTVYMRYNGKDYELQGITGENQKFENGKLQVAQSTTATVEVTDLVNKEVNRGLSSIVAKQKNHGSVGGWVTSEGFAVSVSLGNKDRQISAIATVPDVQKFYGGGVVFKF